MTTAILWITILSGPLDGMTFGVPFETLEACRSATVSISDALVYDHNLSCEEALL